MTSRLLLCALRDRLTAELAARPFPAARGAARPARVYLHGLGAGVEPAADDADEQNEYKQADIGYDLYDHIGEGLEFIFKQVNGQMLFAAVNISTAKHYHPNKQILGKGTGDCAGIIEYVTGNDLPNHDDGHYAQSNGGHDLLELVQDEFDLI